MTPPRQRTRAEMAEALSDRDRALLRDLARVRLATGPQLQRLHVADGSPVTRARRSRAVLQRLTDWGLLVRLERIIGGIHAGSSGYTYALSAFGQRVTTGVGPAGGRRLRRPWEPRPDFVTHLLAVTELYVQTVEALREDNGELLAFKTEPPCWRRWHGPSGEDLVLKPDAFVQLGIEEFEITSFVEVDLATESSTVLRRKLQTYVTYWQAGIEQRRHDVFPQVVWVVPTDRRLTQLVGLIQGLPPDAQALFHVVRAGRALEALTGRPPPLGDPDP